MESERLTCSVEEFGALVGIGPRQAQQVCAGEFPPPLIWSGERKRVIRAEVPGWLVAYGRWQRKRKGLVPDPLGSDGDEPEGQPQKRLYQEG